MLCITSPTLAVRTVLTQARKPLVALAEPARLQVQVQVQVVEVVWVVEVVRVVQVGLDVRSRLGIFSTYLLDGTTACNHTRGMGGC
jgi:hypothetical protein